MSNLTKVPIIDKNGKHTTVHKNLARPVKPSATRAAAAPEPPRPASARTLPLDAALAKVRSGQDDSATRAAVVAHLKEWGNQERPRTPDHSSGNDIFKDARTNLDLLQSGQIHYSGHDADISHSEDVDWDDDAIVVTRYESIPFSNIHRPFDFDDIPESEGSLEALASNGDWDALAVILTEHNREEIEQNWDATEFDASDIDERLDVFSEASGVPRPYLDGLVEFRGEVTCGDADADDARSWWEASNRGQRWLDTLSPADRERFEDGEL